MNRIGILDERKSAQATTTIVAAIIIVAIVVGVGVWFLKGPGPKPEKPVEITGLSLSSTSPTKGEEVKAFVDLTNHSATDQSYTFTLKASGENVSTKTVKVEGGKTKRVSVPYTVKENNRTYVFQAGSKRATASVGSPPKLAVVSDIGGRGDLAFNDMAFKGGESAELKLGVKMMPLISSTEEDYLPNLREAARDPDTNLIVGVGYLLSKSLSTVAQEFPNKNFMGIDTYAQSLTENLQPNLMDITFEEHKSSALVGALGALLAAHYDKPHIGAVLGIEIPVLWKFETGYKWGAKWALEKWLPANKPDLAKQISYSKDFVKYTYTGTFSDVAKGYEAAKPMYEKGAVTVYNIAGPLGLGINRAVKERVPKGQEMGPPFWTGVDSDQDWINPGFVIASAMKRVDKGVFLAEKLVKQGKFRSTIRNNDGVITLGIGTEVGGIPVEGVSVSTLANLKEFVKMGVRAEEVTGEKKLPMPPEKIKARVKEMRDAQPDWIWDAVSQLEEKIRSGKPIADLDGDGTPETVPATTTDNAVSYWRDVLG